MDAGRDRNRAIKDVWAEDTILSTSESYLKQHASPDIGGLNLRQSEGIVFLIQVARRIMVALSQIDKDIQRFEKMVDDKTVRLEVGGTKITASHNGEIALVTGEASIFLKKDGTINIRGKDITIVGSGQVQVRASKDLTLKGQHINQN